MSDLDPRLRRKFPKPEQSGLSRIDAIQSFPQNALDDYNQSASSTRAKPDRSDDSAFLQSLEKVIRRKKKLS